MILSEKDPFFREGIRTRMRNGDEMFADGAMRKEGREIEAFMFGEAPD